MSIAKIKDVFYGIEALGPCDRSQLAEHLGVQRSRVATSIVGLKNRNYIEEVDGVLKMLIDPAEATFSESRIHDGKETFQVRQKDVENLIEATTTLIANYEGLVGDLRQVLEKHDVRTRNTKANRKQGSATGDRQRQPVHARRGSRSGKRVQSKHGDTVKGDVSGQKNVAKLGRGKDTVSAV